MHLTDFVVAIYKDDEIKVMSEEVKNFAKKFSIPGI